MKINIFKRIDFKNYLVVFITISLLMIVIGYIVTTAVNNFYYNEMEEEAQRLANNYVRNMETSIEAGAIMNKLLEEKLLAVNYAVSHYSQVHSNELLSDIAEAMEVDAIYAYNSRGEVISSSNDKYIGWTAYPGHPVYEFMHSSSDHLVEDIRQDTETGVYYKYGYFKTGDGRFFQIEVLADKIYQLLGKFELQYLVENIRQDEFVSSVYFMDNQLNIVTSQGYQMTPEQILTPEAEDAIMANTKYTNILTVDGKQLYQIMVPLFIGEEKIGTLVIANDTQATRALIGNVKLYGIVALVLIFSLLATVMYTSYKKNKDLVRHAYYNEVTSLPNSRYFEEFIVEKIRKRKDIKKAILMVNSRNFKLVNLTFGYKYGDDILNEFAFNLSRLCSDNCNLFHLEADRFIIYIQNYRDKKELAELSKNIIETLKDPLVSRITGAVVGIVEIKNRQENIENLLKNAFLAADSVTEHDTFGYSFFDRNMEAKLLRQEYIKDVLKKIINGKESSSFYLEYQPILDLKTGRIYGFEALSRLNSKELGPILPLEFIDIAERGQLMVDLGKLITQKACRFLKNLEMQHFSDIKISINISLVQILRDDFLPNLMEIINETKIRPSSLVLEITESIFSNNYELINQRLEKVREQGIEVALDDFGTGYSALDRVGELNIDSVKIDKYFIDKLVSSDSETALAGDIVSIAHRLGYTTVAEGVEQQSQKDYLIKIGCDYLQGFLFSKPLVVEKAVDLLYKHKGRA